MSHFYAELQGARGPVTRCGSVSSGIWAHIRGWNFGVDVRLSYDTDRGCDTVDLFRTGGSRGTGPQATIATLYEDEKPAKPKEDLCTACAKKKSTTLILPVLAAVRRIS